MEVQGGQDLPHARHGAALGSHRGHETTVNSAVEEPHSRRQRRLVDSKRDAERTTLAHILTKSIIYQTFNCLQHQ